jgi:hypothetical protein
VCAGQQWYRTGWSPGWCGADRGDEPDVELAEVGRDDQAAAVEAAIVPVPGVLGSRQQYATRAASTTDADEQYPAGQ